MMAPMNDSQLVLRLTSANGCTPMPELDLRRSPWNEGLSVPSDYLLRQLYLLGCAVNASKAIEALGVDALLALRGRFQEAEIGRMLITIAAAIRNAMDQNPSRAEYWMRNLENNVGTLEETGKSTLSALTFREACNKILHCTSLNFDYSKVPPMRGGPVTPVLYLYGERNGKDWKATLNVNAFIDHANNLA
jgi:hypothetical protein